MSLIEAEQEVSVEIFYFSCTVNEQCTAYRLSAAEEKNCGLIDENSNQTTFVFLPESHIYQTGGY